MRSTTITIAVLTCLGLAIPASAGPKYFYNAGTPADWNDGGVWFSQGCNDTETTAPVPGDNVIICPGEDCTVDENEEVQRVDVRKDGSDVGILRVPFDVTLTLNEDLGTSDIDGHLLLTGTLRLDWINPLQATHTFSGDGDIEGMGFLAKITVEGSGISGAPTLVNRTTIHGILTIGHTDDGDAILKLDGGTVHADANGTLKISMSLMEDDGVYGNSLLKVSTHSGAILDIDLVCNSEPLIPCAVTCLEHTEVEVFKGRFTFQQAFTTNETLTMQTGGRMVVPADTSGSFDTTVCGG